MNVKAPGIATGLVAGALWATVCFSATPTKSPGSIAGFVSNNGGVPQMGATVLLFDRHDRLLGKALTSDKGSFGFPILTPDVYSIRVTLASFIPALKKNIVVQPGMQSLLNVNLASVFSSIELIYDGPGPVMSDDWKWVLRSSSATRPVLRLRPYIDLTPPERRVSVPGAWTDTSGYLSLSGGDEGRVSALGMEPDLGTAFALATAFGQNRVQVSGNLGYASASGLPSAAFQTSFRRDAPGESPEVRVTMRQMFLPGRVGSALLSGSESAPALRTLSVGYLDKMQMTDDMRMEYGFALDSISFLDRVNYVSPYMRLTYDRSDSEVVQFGYASGVPGAELFASDRGTDLELQQDLAALSMFPRVSLRSGQPRIQRTETYEIGYRKSVGTRTISVAVYRDSIGNAALTMAGPEGLDTTADLLPDLFSNSWVLNAGSFQSWGMLASISQDFGELMTVTAAYGTGGTLTADREELPSGDPENLRQIVRASRRNSLSARVSGTAPATGTQYIASYQWSDTDALTAPHMYMTQRMREGLGLNLRFRQPLPGFRGMPGRIEATAELRNLLAQGYVPLVAGGRRYYLMHTPRSMRGGFSFIF